MNHRLKTIFEQLAGGHDLTRGEARLIFERIMAGEVPQSVIGAVLGALLVKGECVEELVGAAEAMRASAVSITCDPDCIDTCGTGGDGISTFNVSTTAAIIAAAGGATVAKHGNRSTSRVSGSTEVLSELGIDVEAGVHTVQRCLDEARIGYLNARKLHPAMRHAAPVRQEIGIRTIFNLLGPLTSPAGARRQVLGVPGSDLVEKMARALQRLGAKHAWVVHGADGLCDLTITGATTVVEVREGARRRFTVTPEEVGLHPASLDALIVDSPRASADTMLAIFHGASGPARDHALLNAGAALVVAGLAQSLQEAVALAARTVDEGAAIDTLDRWRSIAGTDPGPPANGAIVA